VEDIAIAQKNWREIDRHRDPMRKKSSGLYDLRRILSSYESSRNVDASNLCSKTSSLEPRWTTFDDQMEAFNEMVEFQKESLKVRLEEQVVEHNQALGNFTERWRALKPTEIQHWDAKNVNRVFDEIEESKPLCRAVASM